MSAAVESRLAPEAVVLVPAGQGRAAPARTSAPALERPLVRNAAFAALALYGTIRWATLLDPAPGWRLVGLVLVAALLPVIAGQTERHRRVALMLLAIAGVLLMLALAGLPVRWITHMRVAVSANALGAGLSALPRALVPYSGVNQWLRMVILLGAGVLLLDSALMLALAPRPLSDARRAAVALPLIALAIVPATLVHPSLPYLQGLILFVLAAAFMFGERLRRNDAAMAACLALLAGGAGMLAAPRLDPRSPWLNYQALAGDLAPAHPETFDWSQRYGPLRWPRTGHEVLDVQAARPDYWKAENLDVFDGRQWISASVEASSAQDTVAPANLARWTQTLHVTLRAMRTGNVIASGVAAAPEHLPGNLVVGPSDGTWLAPAELGPGDSYTVTVYDPHPTASELRASGTNYPEALLPAYLTLFVPLDPSSPQTTTPPTAPGDVQIAPFGERLLSAYGPGLSTTQLLARSPYAPTYRLAQRLRRGAATEYAYVQSVLRYLQRGFRYAEVATPGPYPLQRFLLATKTGYCQQFAGAMALLLRMGGVPARVAAGFTPGSYNTTTHQWLVSDINAHAWVEAWFPGYGWVRFDPTPPAAPELGGHTQLPALQNTGSIGSGPSPSSHGLRTPGAVTTHSTHSAAGGVSALLLAALALLALLVTLAIATVRFGEPTTEQLLAELERALARSGRPLADGTTLAALEQRFRSSAEASAYIRTLRLARFAGLGGLPSPAQRRALRAQLRAGLGLSGLVRALWALPPRVAVGGTGWKPSSTGIHSR